MLCLIPIVGGLLIMMGQHDRSEALFYYFRLEDQVPETHLLRLIEKHISFEFGRERLKDSYSETGRPSKLFERLFEQIVLRCVGVGLVQGKHLSVDGSFAEANAAKESRIPREQLAEMAQVNQSVRRYPVELEQQNPAEEPVHQQGQVSTTDPT
jgi:hypothetical protein